jgi:dTDP-glucose 4,6-dehydratase
MHVLMSGGAGFIGSHLMDLLLADGHSVVVMDNLLTGSTRNLRHLEGNPKFRYIEQDVTKPFSINDKFDAVLHLASPASPKDYYEHPVATLDVGSIGTKNMLEIATRDNARFLLTSTSECYGDPLEHPQKETYWGNVNPIGIRSCYDESKRFAEAMVMAFHRKHGTRTTIARIFNTYGPRMQLKDGRVVPAFLDQALSGEPLTIYGDGSQTRSFCFVSDLVNGLYKLFMSEERLPVNIGNPAEITIKQFAETIQSQFGGSTIEYRPLPEDDPKRRQPDITKARTVLAWEPKVLLADGLKQTIDYFRQEKIERGI